MADIHASPLTPWRFAAFGALLAAEIVLLTLSFEPSRLGNLPAWSASLLAHSSTFLRIAIAMAATLLLVLSPRYADVIGHFDGHAQPNRVAWVLVQVAAFSALFQQTDHLFRGGGSGAWSVAGWLLLCLAVLGAWALALAPWRAWWQFLARERPALLASLAAGLAAWLFGLATQVFWRPMAQWTLYLAHGILREAYPEVAYDPVAGTVGTSRLVLEIAPQCSGYEGMALVSVFVAVYLWLFRSRLAFPRALWLLPVGLAAMWAANVLRIAALVAVGTSISPDIAVGGFHSQAGWIAFTLIALGLIAASHRLGLVMKPGGEPAANPAAPYLVPLIALLATSMVTAAFTDGFDALYPAGVLVTALALFRYRAALWPVRLDRPVVAVAIGIAVFALWMALQEQAVGVSGAAAPPWAGLSPALAAAWIAFRVAGSVLTVPIAEELAFRGYLMRKLAGGEFDPAAPLRFTALSFVASSVLFGLLHHGWIAGTLAGAAFALAALHRGRLSDAVVAHMTANALIAASVLGFGRWDLWL